MIAKRTKKSLLLKGMNDDYKRLILHKIQDDWSKPETPHDEMPIEGSNLIV